MNPTSVIEISRSAVEHNVNFIRHLIGDSVTFSSVVKGNAYGHGIEVYCPLAYENGVRHFSVFSADEAYRVKNCVPNDCTVLIMGMISADQMEWALENDVEFFVFDLPRLYEAQNASLKSGKVAKVHLEVETGMNRTGMSSKELKIARNYMQDNHEQFEWMGICTHLAGAESIANYHRISIQRKRFKRLHDKLQKEAELPPFAHAACSAAAMRYPMTRYNLVRIGILQYGFFPSREIAGHYMSKFKDFHYPLERIISWKSRVMDLKSVKAGEFIGYGNSFYTNIDTEIALVPVGYAHGFSRSLSNQGRVLIRGKRLNVVGMVNMNIMAIDVTELDGIERGDEVVMIGNQNGTEMSVASFGEYSHQVNYELLTRLPQDIPRKIV